MVLGALSEESQPQSGNNEEKDEVKAVYIFQHPEEIIPYIIPAFNHKKLLNSISNSGTFFQYRVGSRLLNLKKS
jgi:hypothetical protein